MAGIPFVIVGEDAQERYRRWQRLVQEAEVSRLEVEARESNVRAALAADTDAAANARRERAAGGDAEATERTEPAAQAALAQAERELAAARAAVTGEAAEFALHIGETRSVILARSTEAESGAVVVARQALDELEKALEAREIARMVRSWLDRPVTDATVHGLGNLRPVCRDEIATITRTLDAEGVRDTRAEQDANRAAWDALVARARASVPQELREDAVLDPRTGSKTVPAVDAAIEAEVEQLRRAGEPVPRPTSEKWQRRIAA